MGSIFISHSSKDDAVAQELAGVLMSEGHASVFLDFDPAKGIPAGRDWERELYRQMQRCQAVVVLSSVHSSASQWCFAEITQARALGKEVFPVRTDDAPMWPLLRSLQTIDLRTDRQASWRRLLHGLSVAGLDTRDTAQWDGKRPPYPGLLAFEADDEAVYFGRDDSVQLVLETLVRLRRFGGSRLVLVLGPSGCGKSSLVRAGVSPQLRRRAGEWIVVPPLRPLS